MRPNKTIKSRDFSDLVFNFLKKNKISLVSEIRKKTIDDVKKMKRTPDEMERIESIIDEIEFEVGPLTPTKREILMKTEIENSELEFSERQKKSLLHVIKWKRDAVRRNRTVEIFTYRQLVFFCDFVEKQKIIIPGRVKMLEL